MERAWVRNLMCLSEVFDDCSCCPCHDCVAEVCMLAHKYKDEWPLNEVPCVEPAATYELNFMQVRKCPEYVKRT